MLFGRQFEVYQNIVTTGNDLLPNSSAPFKLSDVLFLCIPVKLLLIFYILSVDRHVCDL